LLLFLHAILAVKSGRRLRQPSKRKTQITCQFRILTTVDYDKAIRSLIPPLTDEKGASPSSGEIEMLNCRKRESTSGRGISTILWQSMSSGCWPDEETALTSDTPF